MPDIPEEAVQAAAEVLYREYDSEYDADHLSWRDFTAPARAVLEAAAPVLAAHARATTVTALHAVAESPGMLHRFVDRHPELHEGVTVRGVLLAVADEIEGEARA